MIAPGVPVRTSVADRNLFRVRMREADAARLNLTGVDGSPAAWERAGAWLSALVDIPVDVTAVDVAEDPGTGERWAFVTVRPAGCVDAELAEAVRSDHPCDDRSCDVAVALEQGYPQVAASLLLGATDAPAVEALVRMGRAVVPADLASCRGWDDWVGYHSRYGRRCASCGAFTYGNEEQSAQACGECLQPFRGPDEPRVAAEEDAAVRRINEAMEGDSWQSSPDCATWRAPGQFVPDPVGGLGNLGLRLPGAFGGELGGDTPYWAAVAALDTYTWAAAANAEAAANLEAQLTVHGFDRDQELMSHVAALREAAAGLQAYARQARLGIFTRHAVGDEYHTGCRDAAASAFRTGSGGVGHQDHPNGGAHAVNEHLAGAPLRSVP